MIDDRCVLVPIHEPEYFDMHQQVYGIRQVDEKDHPEFGEPGFEAAKEMAEADGDIVSILKAVCTGRAFNLPKFHSNCNLLMIVLLILI